MYLIGKTSREAIPIKLTMMKCTLEWKVSGEVSFVDMGNGFTLVKFSNEVDCNRVYEGQSWLVGGQVFSLRRWKKELHPVKEPLSLDLHWLGFLGFLWRSGLTRP